MKNNIAWCMIFSLIVGILIGYCLSNLSKKKETYRNVWADLKAYNLHPNDKYALIKERKGCEKPFRLGCGCN